MCKCKTTTEVCDKRACFNYIGLKPAYCKKHKDDKMVDVFHRKCLDTTVDCGKRPSFNYDGLKKGLYVTTLIVIFAW